MKSILEFTLPADEADFRLAQMGPELHSLLSELDSVLRGWLKHGHSFESADEALEAVRDLIQSGREDLSINFESIP